MTEISKNDVVNLYVSLFLKLDCLAHGKDCSNDIFRILLENRGLVSTLRTFILSEGGKSERARLLKVRTGNSSKITSDKILQIDSNLIFYIDYLSNIQNKAPNEVDGLIKHCNVNSIAKIYGILTQYEISLPYDNVCSEETIIKFLSSYDHNTLTYLLYFNYLEKIYHEESELLKKKNGEDSVDFDLIDEHIKKAQEKPFFRLPRKNQNNK